MFRGDRLKEIREEMDLSQEAFGKLIGVSKVTICGYENETRTPKMIHFEKMVETLNVTADYLLGRDTMIVSEDEVPYQKMVSKEEIVVIELLRTDTKLFSQLRDEPERTMELIHRRLYK